MASRMDVLLPLSRRTNQRRFQDGNPDGGVALRGNYAGIGYTYDSANDVFYPPAPYPLWVISAPNWIWAAPVPMPETGGPYKWDEPSKSWVVTSLTNPVA